jgi:hypothetical protein
MIVACARTRPPLGWFLDGDESDDDDAPLIFSLPLSVDPWIVRQKSPNPPLHSYFPPVAICI